DVVTTSGESYIVTGSASVEWSKTRAYTAWIGGDGTKAFSRKDAVRDGNTVAYSIARDNYEFYITGTTDSFSGSQDFFYIIKLYLASASSFGSRFKKEYGIGVGRAIEVDSSGDVIAAGEKAGNSFLIKVDSNGNHIWNITLDSGEATSVKVDSSGNYIVLANKNDDIQIFKVTSAGDVSWKKTFDTTSTDLGKDLIIDGSQYVITGKRDGDLYMMKTTAPCIAECSSGAVRCNGDYKQTCGNYDSDSCSEWPDSPPGDGNDDCQYGC
ncbi:unnamed protein product, partial [marine sediment metagenome]